MSTLQKIAIACVIGLFIYGLWPSGDDNYQPEYSTGKFTIKNDKYHVEYEIDESETTHQGVLTMTNDGKGISQGGIVKTLHYLTEDDASEFRSTHKTNVCPAPFFNEHAKLRLLIPKDAAVEKQLSDLHFEDYRDSTEWRKFSITGHCIQSVPVIKMEGKEGRVKYNNMFKDCMTMVVSDFTVSSN
jgi:hypothetical protein